LTSVGLILLAACLLAGIAVYLLRGRYHEPGADLLDALHSAPFGILRIDGHGKITYLNSAARAILRLQSRLVEGFHFGEALGSGQLEEFRGLAEQFVSGSALSETAKAVVHLGEGGIEEAIFVWALRTPARGRRKGGVVLLFHPSESIDPFLGRHYGPLSELLVHEIKNHLSAVEMGMDQLERALRQHLAGDARAQELLARLRRRIRTMNGLASRYRKLIDPRLSGPEGVELGNFLRRWQTTQLEWLPGDIQLRLQLPRDREMWADVDKDLLQTCLDLSLGLVLPSMLEGGEILVEAHPEEETVSGEVSRTRVNICIVRDGRYERDVEMGATLVGEKEGFFAALLNRAALGIGAWVQVEAGRSGVSQVRLSIGANLASTS
jgi:hypothetical protein